MRGPKVCTAVLYLQQGMFSAPEVVWHLPLSLWLIVHGVSAASTVKFSGKGMLLPFTLCGPFWTKRCNHSKLLRCNQWFMVSENHLPLLLWQSDTIFASYFLSYTFPISHLP